MYHCGTAPALHHIGNGMYGAIIIDPPDLPPVDHEYVVVQSELYLGPEGKPGDLTKMHERGLDAVVFNGYVNQYQFTARSGWSRASGSGSGCSTPARARTRRSTSSARSSTPSSRRARTSCGPTRGGAAPRRSTSSPRRAGSSSSRFDEAGLYPIVTHKFANVGKGALGLFQAGDAESRGGH